MPEPEQPEDHWRGMGHSRVVRGQPVEEEEGDGERSSVASSSGSGGFDYKIKPNGEVEPIGGEEEEEEEEEEGEEEEGEEQAEEGGGPEVGFIERTYTVPAGITSAGETLELFKPTKNVAAVIAMAFRGQLPGGEASPVFFWGTQELNTNLGETNDGVSWGTRGKMRSSPLVGEQPLIVKSSSGVNALPNMFIWVRILYHNENILGVGGWSEVISSEANNNIIADSGTVGKAGTLFCLQWRRYEEDRDFTNPPDVLASAVIPVSETENKRCIVSRGLTGAAEVGGLRVVSCNWPKLITGGAQYRRGINAFILYR